MLEEPQILLSLQEMDLEVRVAKLAEEQARGLHSFDGWDLSVELEEHRTDVAGVKDEHTTEAGGSRCWSWRPPMPYSTSRSCLSETFPSSRR
jgi:hypothetical protein